MTAGGADPVVVQSRFLPVLREVAHRALPRQPELPWPAKLVLSREGTPGLVAEVPRLGARAQAAELADQALLAGRAWLDDEAPESAPANREAGELEALLEAGPHPWSRLEEGGYRLDVEHRGVVGRMRLEPFPTGALHLLAEGAVGLGDASAWDVLRDYALEVNGRLRLARVSVGSGGGPAAWVVWDVVLPAGLPQERALGEGVGALVAARALTEESLRALAVPAGADRYRSLRANGRPDGMGRTK